MSEPGKRGARDVVPSADEWAQVKRDPASVTSGGQPEAPVPAAVLQEMLDALRAAAPNEGCGILVSDRYWAEGGAAARWVGMRNAAASPYRYMIDPDEQFKVWTHLEDAGEVVWAIVHSHVASPARPSQTDVGLAFYPESLYVVVSLTEPDRPDARAWTIVDGVMSEVALLVS